MSETETEAPGQKPEAAPGAPTGKVRGRGILLGLLGGIAAVTGLAQVFGGTAIALGAGGTAAAGTAGYVAWRRRKVRKAAGKRSRTWTVKWDRRSRSGGQHRRFGGGGSSGRGRMFGGRSGGAGRRGFGRGRSGGSAGGSSGRGRLFGRRGRGGSGPAGGGSGRPASRGRFGRIFRGRGGRSASGGPSSGRSGGGRWRPFSRGRSGGRAGGSASGRGGRHSALHPFGGPSWRARSAARRMTGRPTGWSRFNPWRKGTQGKGSQPVSPGWARRTWRRATQPPGGKTPPARRVSGLRRAWWRLTPGAAWRARRPGSGQIVPKPGGQRSGFRRAAFRLVPASIRRRWQARQLGRGRWHPVARVKGLWARIRGRQPQQGSQPVPDPSPDPGPDGGSSPPFLPPNFPEWAKSRSEAAPGLADVIPIPTDRGSRTPAQPTGGSTMATPADQFEEAAGELSNWTPSSGDELDEFLKRWPDVVRNVGQSLSTMVDNWDGEHIHEGVKESLKEHGQVLGGAGDSAEDAFGEHRNKHSLWLD